METNWKKEFFVIYLGQAFSIIGSAVAQFAIIWYLTLKTESAITLTLATIVSFLPSAVLGPIAGVIADRYSRKRIMIGADALVALSSLLLAVFFIVTPEPSVLLIYLILFLRGLGGTFHMPAMQAAIPTLVPVEYLEKAGGWSSFVTSGSNIIGPLLGALLMGIFPIASIMLVDITGAVFAIICLIFVRIPSVIKEKTSTDFSLKAELAQGFNALKENRLLMAALPQYVLVGILYFPLSSLFPLIVLTHYKGGALENGFIETAFALGMLMASIGMGLFGGIKRRFVMFSAAIVLLGLSIGIIGSLPANLFFICVMVTFVAGTTATFFNVPFYAYIQESVKPEQMGKVMSLLLTLCTIANPIGLVIAGPVSEVIGVNNWFVGSGIALVIIGLVCLLRTRAEEDKYLIENLIKETATLNPNE